MHTDNASNYEKILNIYFRLIIAMTEDTRRFGFRITGQASWKGRESWRYEPTWRAGGYEVVVWDSGKSIIRSSRNPITPPLTFSDITFLIKYYPHPDEEVFEDFSIREQLVRLSPCFNEETRFPSETCSQKLHDSFFVVGTLNISANEDLGILRLALQTQDRFTSVLEENLEMKGVVLREAGAIDRNVPGWQLSWEFYRNLLSLYTSKLGKPWLIIGVAEPGLLWKCGADNCEAEESSSRLLKTIETVYISTKDLQVINLIDEAVDQMLGTIRSKQQRIYTDNIVLPYIKVLFKDNNSAQSDLIFTDVLEYLSQNK